MLAELRTQQGEPSPLIYYRPITVDNNGLRKIARLNGSRTKDKKKDQADGPKSTQVRIRGEQAQGDVLK